MISHLRYSLKYIRYFLFAKHKKGHSIHSPFVYNFITKVLNNKTEHKNLIEVINIHNKYLKSKRYIEFKDIGAGTNYYKSKKLKLGKIVKRSSIDKKHGKLIYNLIKYYDPSNILEIGTSVGISSAYIAQAAPQSSFISIEGVEEKIQIAKEISLKLNQKTEFIHGNFDNTLNSVLEKYEKFDLVFFDGNHTKQSTLNYFNSSLEKSHNESIFIFDDIHWSTDMEEAWEIIKINKKVKVSIDIFRMGLIFFKKKLSYQQYVIKF
ncbi:MAG: class I SAM-dependent methyltransferase [Bacteroidales bacterium]|jgi:predicted O-methyltransferase YrrM|nr:class I SAM-dependent methyltransferase [Bacteroidales bacterium]